MELLEKRVVSARKLLEDVLPKLEANLSDEMPKRLQHIRHLLNKPLDTKSIIGVMGPTGAGKSAMLNAVLDEDLILPTSDMRACTATVTEILYNESDVPYKACVEFISRDDWSRELQALISDIQDDDGNFHEDTTRGDTVPGLAFSKLRAVYPDLSYNKPADIDLEELAIRGLAQHLGSTVAIEDHDPKQFYAQLQRYIDSKEKTEGFEDGSDIGANAENKIEYWPLVKVVRIFLKSDVLKDGAVLVDLPGVADSNAARGAIAESYAQKCDGIFVVTPIHRAADDGVGKRLFDKAFARQVKLDGMASGITWVCTKADLISEKESIRNIEIHNKTKPLREARDSLKPYRAALQTQAAGIESELKTSASTVNDINKQLSEAQASLRNSEYGRNKKGIYSSTLKRKRSLATSRDQEMNTGFSNLNKRDTVGISAGDEEVTKLTLVSEEAMEDCIEERVTELENCQRDAQSKQLEIFRRQTSNRSELSRVKREIGTINNQITKMCIEARNDYCCAAIKRGLKKEIAPAGATDPSDLNGLDSKADEWCDHHSWQVRDVSVICVSSHAYQNFRNPPDDDQAVRGFECVEDTKIPLLRERCQRTAKALRRVSLEAFLNDVNILVASLGFWASDRDGVFTNPIPEETLCNMVQKLLDDSNADVATIEAEVETSLFKVVSQVSPAAEKQALDIASKWRHSMRVRAYKATVCRGGCFANKNGSYNFNDDLAGPMLDIIAPAWENFFLQTIPRTLRRILERFKQGLDTFVTLVQCLRTGNEDCLVFLQKFKKQLGAYVRKLESVLKATESRIQQTQRGINRSGAHFIQGLLMATYSKCSLERGVGMFDRMSQKMWNGVNDKRRQISLSAMEGTKAKVSSMVRSVRRALKADIKDICDEIREDCMQLMHEEQDLRTAELQKLRKEIRALIHKFERDEKRFGSVAGPCMRCER